MPHMKIIKKFIIFAYFMFFVMTAVSYACEPCYPIFNFEETVKEADLIIIGREISEGPITIPGERQQAGPDWIEVKVLQVLKGESQEEKITVNSWDGMCPVGIFIAQKDKDKDYVFFLQKRSIPDEPYQFDAVHFGCAVQTYPLEGELINFEGKKISIEDFQKHIPHYK